MNGADLAMKQLSAMVDDTENHPLFQGNGPLAWFSLKKTFLAAARRAALSEKQCKLIDKVHTEYKDLRRAAHEFARSEESFRLRQALQDLQKVKPKAIDSAERSRSQRLSRIVHALFNHRAIHVGDFDDAERLVAELANARVKETWEMIHAARRRYLSALYPQATGSDVSAETIDAAAEERSSSPGGKTATTPNDRSTSRPVRDAGGERGPAA